MVLNPRWINVLNISFSLLDTSIFFFLSLQFIWSGSKMSTAKNGPAVLLLRGARRAGWMRFLCFFCRSDQQQSSPCCRRTGEGQGWAPRGYYAFLNQTNDRPIMRTVLCRPVCASINKTSVFSVEPQPNVYCSLYIHCGRFFKFFFKKKRGQCRKPRCTQMKISPCKRSRLSAYECTPK